MVVTDTKHMEVAATAHQRRTRWRPPVLGQFIKFCLVGAISTALNIGLGNLFLIWGFHVNAAHVCAFSLAVTNGFFLNRAWTFRRSGSARVQQQYVMFVAVNLVGLVLSWAIMRTVMDWLLQTHTAQGLAASIQQWSGHFPDVTRLAYSLGELTATPVVAIWNFTANKLWTFGGKRK